MTADVLTVSRRPAEPADDALLHELFYASRPELALLPPAMQEMQFDAQRRHYEAAYPHHRHEVLLVDATGVGQLITDDESTGTVRVVDVSVHPAHRRRGIAGAALTTLLSEAGAAGCVVTLSVWPDNAPARHLYARLGFVAVSSSPGAYLELERAPVEGRN